MPTTPPNAKPQVTFGADFERYDPNVFDFLTLHQWNATKRFPMGTVKPLGKVPVAAKWTTMKVASRAVRRRCLAELRNMGIRLKPNQLVIDIDPRNGGDDGFRSLCFDIGLDEGEWPCVVTGSGGRHYYLLLPEGVSVVEMLDDYPGVRIQVRRPSSRRRRVASSERQALSLVAEASRHSQGRAHGPDQSSKRDQAAGLWPTPRARAASTRPNNSRPCSRGSTCWTSKTKTTWRQLMFACHHATDGDGEAEFVAWSAGDPNFAGDSASVVKRWRSCRDKANAITAGTLRHILREHGAADVIPPRDVPEDDFPDDIRDATDARTSGARTHVQPSNVRDVKASPHINVRDAGTKRRKAMP